jgi:catechol 2,3-dioxygenase
MTTTQSQKEATAYRIPATTRMGPAHYLVADLEAQIAFYEKAIGFKLHRREGDFAALGAGQADLLHLTHVPGAQPARRTTGLYHTAWLVPTRDELVQHLKRIAETRTPVQGMSDHETHLAIYLPDAEGNGIELAWDFPRERWPMVDGKVNFSGGPKFPQELVDDIDKPMPPWAGAHADTQVGHEHLHVADLNDSRRFYHEVLGFDVVADMPLMRALFVSAGGYHHHIGLNTWQGEGAPPPPPNSTGLRYITVALPTTEDLETVADRVEQAGISIEQTEDGLLTRDPAQNGVLLTVQEP